MTELIDPSTGLPFKSYTTVDGEYMSIEAVAALNRCINGTKADWRLTTPASLRGHIVKHHLRPATLCAYGVARYDIELAKFLGFPLDWVVKKTYERLEESDEEIKTRIWDDIDHLKKARTERMYRYLDIQSYKLMLARNLKYIEQLGLGEINWVKVAFATDCQTIDFDLQRDSHDEPFSSDRLF